MISLLAKKFIKNREDVTSPAVRQAYGMLCGIVGIGFNVLLFALKLIAGTLSGGEQQMLAMGRALMSHPKTILMDEPSMGLSPKLVKEIFSIIRKLHEQGITILLVEQNAKMALSIADRAYVLETGRITMEGDAKELLNNEQVRKAYLGA